MTMIASRRLDHRTAAELRALDGKVIAFEEAAAWSRVRTLAERGHLHLVAEQAHEANQALGAISYIAARRLRQLGGDAA